MSAIVRDIAEGRYSDLQLAAFVTACAGNRLDPEETLSLTRAMIEAGDRLRWPYPKVGDKHCVGGLPGNRTTLIVVPIVAALGVPIPKTSSRAITSPAGTADTYHHNDRPVRLRGFDFRHQFVCHISLLLSSD
jgi:thymidine phosphorylase